VVDAMDDGSCRVCGVDDDDGLLCDGCDGVRHARCLEMGEGEVPVGDWFCPTCVRGGVTVVVGLCRLNQVDP
jgi:hypothetical protein